MRIEALSLYSAAPSVEATFGNGVFYLAGANGLGKSTFLSALNFALTGVVPEPSRTFQSVEEYYRHNLAFAKDYFDGRVDESDRDAAEVCVEMQVGQFLYTVTRGMFEPEELRGLRIETVDEDGPVTVVDLSDV